MREPSVSGEMPRRPYRQPYQQPQSSGWWLRTPFFLRYMLREATAVWVLLYALVLLYTLVKFSAGEAAWNAWLTRLNHPVWIAFHACVLLAVVYHTATWFRLAPKIMVLRIGKWRLPETWMLMAQWVALAVVTVLALWAVFVTDRVV